MGKIIISSIRSIFILLLVLATQFWLFSTFQPYCILTTFALQQNLIYNQSITNSNKSENKKVTRWKRLQTYFLPMHLDDIYNSRNELLSIEQKGYKKSNTRWLRNIRKHYWNVKSTSREFQRITDRVMVTCFCSKTLKVRRSRTYY